MNRIASWSAPIAIGLALIAGIWAAMSMENVELLQFVALAMILLIFWIWRRMNIIIDERLVLIYEKTAVRTLEVSVLVLFLFSVFILGIGYFADASNLLDWGYALVQNIILIIAVFIIFWLYYTRKFGA
ncbi:MAG: DUF2178 domain-containing protein [Methanocalculus sp.]|uniref:DUF2178 domain-containing protein n=1 Tax=Methanocalculus sp. TaxID=2004547 RepID=UPI00271614C7|nr:DUF2178 domain-containing protein [Methanocalculus sp.]MDO8841833.1 DUF2178 domain-containing protein [Methanocalculus sp.]MDO9539044.1 DUF2178 domain-containing protein [Methanocalculus sp.]